MVCQTLVFMQSQVLCFKVEAEHLHQMISADVTLREKNVLMSVYNVYLYFLYFPFFLEFILWLLCLQFERIYLWTVKE